MLTSLFVCQPNYNATRHRLKLRIIGTLVGIAIGIPVLWFVPSLEGQLVLLVITGVLFFAFRNVQYAHATMFITLLVLLCFNLLGEGFEVKLRIIGTLVGIAIGIPVLWFVPSLEGQLVLLVITGVLFFAFRNVQYAHATMFITLLVLLCFNLLGEGFEVALPRRPCNDVHHSFGATVFQLAG